jgi:hypothetical protein
MQDRDPLDRLCGNGDQSAVGAEELIYLRHETTYAPSTS